MERQRQRIGQPSASEQLEGASSLAEVKEFIQAPEVIPAGQQRLILSINEEGNVTAVPTTTSQLLEVPPHNPDTLVFQIVQTNGQPILVVARKDDIYEDLNAALNYLNQTQVLYQIDAVPVKEYDFDKLEPLTQRRFPPRKMTAPFQAAVLRGMPPDTDINQLIIPIIATPTTKKQPPRTAKTERGRGAGKRQLMKQAGVQAFRQISEQYEGEQEEQESTLDEQDLAELYDVLDPLLAFVGELDEQKIPQELIDNVAAYIVKTGGTINQQALNQWMTERQEDFPVQQVFGVIKWLDLEAENPVAQQIARKVLGQIPETGIMAFETIQREPEKLTWVQCDHCDKWRVLRPGMPEPKDDEKWYCYTPGAMDIRGMDEEVQELFQMLADVRAKLRLQLPVSERIRLTREEKRLQQEVCDIPQETEEEAADRVALYSNVVVENPKWRARMMELDRETALQEVKEEQLQNIFMSQAEEGKVKDLLAQDAAKMQDLLEGKVGPADPELSAKMQVRDDIDYLADLMQARQEELDDLEESLNDILTIETLQQKLQDPNLDPTQKEILTDELSTLDLSLSEHKATLLAEYEKLKTEQNEDGLRMAQLYRSQKKTLPSVAQGEQNEVFILQAAANLIQDGKHAYLLHSANDITPLANQLKTTLTGNNMGAKPASVVADLTNPNKYQFLKAKAVFAPFILVGTGSGFLIPRSRIRSQDDVNNAVAEVTQKWGKISSEDMTALKLTLQQVLQENQILPYILGGAYLVLAEEEIKKAAPAKQLTTLQQRFEIPPNIAQDIFVAYNKHVQRMLDQSAESNKPRSRPNVVKSLWKVANAMETMRLSGEVPARTRTPWWTILEFPIIPPSAAASTAVSASGITGMEWMLQPPPSALPVPASSSFSSSSSSFLLQPPPAALPAPISSSSSSSSSFLQPPPAALPKVTTKRKEKPTREEKEGPQPKKPKTMPAGCSAADLEQIRQEALRLNLSLILKNPKGIVALCREKFSPVVGVRHALDYLRQWRDVVDVVTVRLASMGLTVPPDETIQAVALQTKFLTPAQQDEIYRKLGGQ